MRGSGEQGQPIARLPSALEEIDEITSRLGGNTAVFLDYDGTLTPIVDDPDQALLPELTREAIVALAEVCPVALVSGRDVADVRDKVSVDGIFYAGSHGFDVVHPDRSRTAHPEAEPVLPDLDGAQRRLEAELDDVPGARVERKRFAVAVHFRRVPPEHHERVAEVVDAVARGFPQLRKTGGKMIFELRPGVDWDKGRAVGWLLDALGVPDAAPVYVGDDLTDEDAFRAVRARGVGVVVHGSDHPTLARYGLQDTEEVRVLLERLANALSGA